MRVTSRSLPWPLLLSVETVDPPLLVPDFLRTILSLWLRGVPWRNTVSVGDLGSERKQNYPLNELVYLGKLQRRRTSPPSFFFHQIGSPSWNIHNLTDSNSEFKEEWISLDLKPPMYGITQEGRTLSHRTTLLFNETLNLFLYRDKGSQYVLTLPTPDPPLGQVGWGKSLCLRTLGHGNFYCSCGVRMQATV